MAEEREIHEEKPSKSQLKRDMHQLQEWGQQLVLLKESLFQRLQLPESLRDAVIACRTIRAHEARRRQLQLIGRLMRELSSDEQHAVISQIKAQSGLAQDRPLASKVNRASAARPLK